jgi:methyl-accepting chemotaxis protein
MLQAFRRPPSRLAAPSGAAAVPQQPPVPDASKVVLDISRRASNLGREAAELRGVLDDTNRIAAAQAQAVLALARQLQEVTESQAGIARETDAGLQAVQQVDVAVQAVGTEVGGIVESLHQVLEAAGEITRIALQTRLVAFNASVEAKRAGEAGRGFGVVADAVKDLAAQVERSSKQIMGTVSQLDARIGTLSREIRRPEGAAAQGAVHQALDAVEQGVRRILQASERSRDVCQGLDGQMRGIEAEIQRTTAALGTTLGRTDSFLVFSEQLIDTVAGCGIETEDTPYIRAAQQAAAAISAALEQALRSGTVRSEDLFDEGYQPVPGSNPAQHLTRFTAVADRLFPAVQEPVLKLSDKVVFCIAADRNGYIACHNQQYNHPQRSGDVLWNTAHCRNRRIFNDRTGLASARNRRPFLLQTYRRDMGGGQFVVMKEVAAPIVVDGRHWGGLRLAFKF